MKTNISLLKNKPINEWQQSGKGRVYQGHSVYGNSTRRTAPPPDDSALSTTAASVSDEQLKKLLTAWLINKQHQNDPAWLDGKTDFMQKPFGIAWDLSPRGRHPSKEQAVIYYVIAKLLNWTRLETELHRTVFETYRVGQRTAKELITKVFGQTQAEQQQFVARLNKLASEAEKELANAPSAPTKKARLKEAVNLVDKLEKTTPYMLRNDGALLRCGDIHPYIKTYFEKDFNGNLEVLKEHPQWVSWFYNNTAIEETRDLIREFLYKINWIDLIGELKIEKGNWPERDAETIFNELTKATNQEFCRVRTSNFKYKYGGDNGEIYFRISSTDFNWFDLIWITVNNFKSQINTVSIMKDFEAFGEPFSFIKVNGTPINKMPIEEFLTLKGQPVIEELPLTEDIEQHDELNPKLFKEQKLLPEVREAIMQIVDEVLFELEDKETPITVKDVQIVGSNADYNYTKDSDIDVHLIVDKESVAAKPDVYKAMYDALRTIWNDRHTITIHGIPVEIYFQLEDESNVSNGCYSVQNDAWVSEPQQQDIPEFDQEAFDKIFSEWESRYNKIMKKENLTNET